MKTLCWGHQRFLGNLILKVDLTIDFGIIRDFVEVFVHYV